MVDWRRLHRVAMAEFDLRVRQIPPDHWGASTPCEEWDVYDLVRHNIVENRWVPLLLAGATVAEAAPSVEMDDDETDPTDAWEESRLAALAAFDKVDLDDEVMLSRGPTPALTFLQERASDLLVHAWDLARAVGAEDTLDDEAVAAVWEVSWPMRDVLANLPQYFDPPIDPAPDADLQTRLLALFGREA
jgi:uncharacterized protein (TIGR03086 family)